LRLEKNIYFFFYIWVIFENLSLVISMKTIKDLVTDIKELSRLHKQALTIFHDNYERYDFIMTAVSFLLFAMGLVLVGLNFQITGRLVLGLALYSFFWWSTY